MGAFYGKRIRSGKMTLEEVPTYWKKATEKWLKEHPEEVERCPKLSKLWVTKSVLAFILAQAAAASIPAFPPPTTITSYSFG